MSTKNKKNKIKNKKKKKATRPKKNHKKNEEKKPTCPTKKKKKNQRVVNLEVNFKGIFESSFHELFSLSFLSILERNFWWARRQNT